MQGGKEHFPRLWRSPSTLASAHPEKQQSLLQEVKFHCTEPGVGDGCLKPVSNTHNGKRDLTLLPDTVARLEKLINWVCKAGEIVTTARSQAKVSSQCWHWAAIDPFPKWTVILTTFWKTPTLGRRNKPGTANVFSTFKTPLIFQI